MVACLYSPEEYTMRKKFDSSFKKSSHSPIAGGVWCVEVKRGSTIKVRDSKNPNGDTLSFTADEWAAFIAGVKDGEFDL